MKKWMLRIIALCCFAVSLSFVYIIPAYLWETLPPSQIQLTTFANTEIYPKNQVHPGTFRIELSKEEFLGKAASSKEKMVIVYSPSPHENGSLSVEYWLPATGSAFYHATEKLGKNLFGIDRVKLVNSSLVVYYTNGVDIFLSAVFSLAFLITGIVSFRKSKKITSNSR